MAQSVIRYDKQLPEIPGRLPWEKPASFLVKDSASPTGWSEDSSGRRPSHILLVSSIRNKVDDWRRGGYPGASGVTKRLFEYWFEEDHDVPGFPVPFRFHFCQREAIETLVWLIEIDGRRDIQKLIKDYAKVYKKNLFDDNIIFQTTVGGRRQIRRYVPELEKDGVQELPPEGLCRYAFKMATGSGKTWVMAMAIAWSYLHKKLEPSSSLSTNFLVVAPNVIVYQRLEKDFANSQIFNDLPLIPPEWRGVFGLTVIQRGDSTEPTSSGNLFLTNIQQLYEGREPAWSPKNPVEALLGKRPTNGELSNRRPMLERIRSLEDLVVINDEAHHVHEEGLEWSKTLYGIHETIPNGLNLWLDFSATPKDQNGMYFPWTICDYPLAQAVEDRIVKAPIIVSKLYDPRQPNDEPKNVTKDNIIEKYGYWIRASVQRWKEHWEVYQKLGTKPVLFIMVEKSVYADVVGEHLWKTQEYGFKENEVLVIHTDSAGEVTKADLEIARQAARDVDRSDSPIKAIVSVMMLREGWDVRNVTVVLGLRPFSAIPEILPEQVIGRGLRLMPGIGPDRTQTLEVLGTRKLLDVLRYQLEAEGVGVGVAGDSDPPKPIVIEPLKERLTYDIAVPLTKPNLIHDIRKLADLDVDTLRPIFEQEDLSEAHRVKLRLEFAPTETEVHSAELGNGELPMPQVLVGSITTKAIDRAKLPNRFAELYPITKRYISSRCFGRDVDLDNEVVRSHLQRPEIQDGIASYLARKISELTVERVALEFERSDFVLSETRPFSWRRNLPALEAKKTVFNHVATYNNFERSFAIFLDQAKDVIRFAALGTTEQGESGTQFRVDYLKPSGAIGFYHPDWIVVQKGPRGEVNWIIETKGRVWEGTAAKDEAITDWCRRISAATGTEWRYVRVNQRDFEALRPTTLAQLTEP